MAITIDDSAPGPDPRSDAVSPIRGNNLITEARRAARQWGLDDPRPVIAATQAVLATLKVVEGSTPIASPAPAAQWARLTFPEEAAYWTDDADGDPIIPAPAGEAVSVPPPARPLATGGIITDPPLLLVGEDGCTLTVPERPDEPVPVPPPVDALLVLLDKWLEEDVDDHTANGWAAIREDIETRARSLWAAGVEEGRRQLVPQDAYEAGIYDAGIAEGRRQATEERTEEQHAAAVTVKGCLGVAGGHGAGDMHFWKCSTEGCSGHLCRKDGQAEGAILDGRRTIEPDGATRRG